MKIPDSTSVRPTLSASSQTVSQKTVSHRKTIPEMTTNEFSLEKLLNNIERGCGKSGTTSQTSGSKFFNQSKVQNVARSNSDANLPKTVILGENTATGETVTSMEKNLMAKSTISDATVPGLKPLIMSEPLSVPATRPDSTSLSVSGPLLQSITLPFPATLPRPAALPVTASLPVSSALPVYAPMQVPAPLSVPAKLPVPSAVPAPASSHVPAGLILTEPLPASWSVPAKLPVPSVEPAPLSVPAKLPLPPVVPAPASMHVPLAVLTLPEYSPASWSVPAKFPLPSSPLNGPSRVPTVMTQPEHLPRPVQSAVSALISLPVPFPEPDSGAVVDHLQVDSTLPLTASLPVSPLGADLDPLPYISVRKDLFADTVNIQYQEVILKLIMKYYNHP